MKGKQLKMTIEGHFSKDPELDTLIIILGGITATGEKDRLKPEKVLYANSDGSLGGGELLPTTRNQVIDTVQEHGLDIKHAGIGLYARRRDNDVIVDIVVSRIGRFDKGETIKINGAANGNDIEIYEFPHPIGTAINLNTGKIVHSGADIERWNINCVPWQAVKGLGPRARANLEEATSIAPPTVQAIRRYGRG